MVGNEWSSNTQYHLICLKIFNTSGCSTAPDPSENSLYPCFLNQEPHSVHFNQMDFKKTCLKYGPQLVLTAILNNNNQCVSILILMGIPFSRNYHNSPAFQDSLKLIEN